MLEFSRSKACRVLIATSGAAGTTNRGTAADSAASKPSKPSVDAFIGRLSQKLTMSTLGAADQNSRQEHQDASQNHLKGRGEERGVHVAMTNITDGRQFNRHDSHGEGHGGG